MPKRLFPLFAALAAWVAGAASGAETVRLYDCGSDASPLSPGFLRLTPSGGEGASWGEGGGVSAAEQPLPEVKAGEVPTVWLDALTCDYLQSSGAAELRLAVPPGRYRVWAAMGHPGGHVSQVWNTVVSGPSGRGEATVAGKYGMRSLTLSADADADGLRLRLSTGSRWLLNALAVAPEAEYDRVFAETLEPLWDRILSFPPEADGTWKRFEPETKAHAVPAEWNERQRREGHVLFARPWCEPVWPGELPREGEVEAPVRMFAAPEEWETAAFTLHALRDFGEVALKVGELVSGSGARLPPLEAHFIRYMRLRSYYNVVGEYFEGPEVVMPWSPQRLKQGRNLTVWLTARIPEDALPGDYRGTVEIGLDGLTREVPVTVKVLPIRLLKNPAYVFGTYYRPATSYFGSAPDPYSGDWWRRRYDAELADMRDCGMNMLMNGIGPRAEYSDRIVKKQAAFGLVREAPVVLPVKALYEKHMGRQFAPHMKDAEMPPDAFFDDLADYVKRVRKAAEGRDWPELLFYAADEPIGTDFVVAFLLRILKTVKGAGGNTYVVADLADVGFAPILPYVDVWCSSDFALPPERLAELRRQHPRLRFWAYPNNVTGSNNHVVPVGARMTYGYGLWKSGYTGLMPWIYRHVEGDPWNHLDGAMADCLNKIADDGTPIAVMHWVAFREGIDDGRYLHTLERAAEAARREGRAAPADRAEALLRDLREAVPAQRMYRADGVWDGGTLDAYRWMMAEMIMELQSPTPSGSAGARP